MSDPVEVEVSEQCSIFSSHALLCRQMCLLHLCHAITLTRCGLVLVHALTVAHILTDAQFVTVCNAASLPFDLQQGVSHHRVSATAPALDAA